MFLGYNHAGKIKFYTEQPLDPYIYNLEKVEETQDEYVLDGDEFVLRTPEWDEKQLEEAKQLKYEEALLKAKDFEQNGCVEYKNAKFEMSDSNRNNLRETQEALTLMGQESTEWNDKDDNIITLTIEDIQYIRLNLILNAVRTLWIESYPAYLVQIAEAQTVEEVNNIVINYEVPNGISI